MAEERFSQRASRVTDDTVAEIMRLAIRQVSQAEIARRVQVNRHTVRRVIKRTRGALTINRDLEQERAEAIIVYREIQRSAWESVENALKVGRSPAMALAEGRQSQQRIDTLTGIEPPKGEDPLTLLAQFKATV